MPCGLDIGQSVEPGCVLFAAKLLEHFRVLGRYGTLQRPETWIAGKLECRGLRSGNKAPRLLVDRCKHLIRVGRRIAQRLPCDAFASAFSEGSRIVRGSPHTTLCSAWNGGKSFARQATCHTPDKRCKRLVFLRNDFGRCLRRTAREAADHRASSYVADGAELAKYTAWNGHGDRTFARHASHTLLWVLRFRQLIDMGPSADIAAGGRDIWFGLRLFSIDES
ncbi:hypothetical protein [Rhizobium leguminosarum]|uniref:hypothetical protein n=1 Tax=Rhizobium leguminosarum TaxID=384 RepID=UPI0012DB277B|nr:hypothetical protein [Rhizobium leguminosarum]